VALLAYLALRAAHGPERRDTLLGMFWPESSTNHARGALRNALHFLRGALGPGAIRSIGSEEVHLDLDLIWCDAVELDRLCDAGDLAAALRLYDGDLLEGFYISEAPEFEHWVDGERARLRQRAAEATRTLAAKAEATGETGLAIVRLRHLLALAPTDEGAARHLMRLLAAADDRGQALRVFADLEALLQDEYGLQPAPETRALADAVRDGEPTGAASLPEPTASPGPEPGDAAVTLAPEPGAPAASRPGTPGRPPTARRPRALPAIAVITAAVALAVAALLIRPGTRDVGAPNVLAVLPFEYRGAPAPSYLADGLADLLAANLNGAGDLRVVDPRALFPAVQTLTRPIEPAAARREAAARGAGLFVLGAITEASGQLRVAASLYGPDTRSRSASTDVVVQGDAEDILTLVDRLTFGLLEGRGGPGLAGATLRTTGSVPALKAFLRGEAALRAAAMQEAIDQYRQATELDTTFALAHYRLSSAAYRQGIARLPARSAAAALRHAGRLAREDSLLVAAWNHHVEGSAAEAHRFYREALILRPGHVEAEFQLGELLFHWGSAIGIPASAAREPFTHVLAAEPANVDAAAHLARLAARDGRFAELDSLALMIRRLQPDGTASREMDQLRAFLSADRAWQDRVVAEVAEQPGQDREVLERAAALSSNLAAVERVALARLQLERDPADQARFQLFLAQVQLARGRYRDAVSGVEGASTLPAPRRLEYRAMMASLPFLLLTANEVASVRAEIAAHPELALADAGGPVAGRGIEYPHLLWPGLHRLQRLYLLGALHTRLGDGAAAEAVADSLAQYAADRIWASSYERLTRARAAVAAGQPDAALRFLGPVEPPARRTFESLVDHARPYERWLRAELLLEAGRASEALRWYATFPDPLARDLAYLAPSHFRRAEILDAAGDPDQAAVHYRHFIDLWTHADPELQPEVSRARERLGRLTSR
jgi:DNA-binding SARP family transcriptional activator/TolB-like protein